MTAAQIDEKVKVDYAARVDLMTTSYDKSDLNNSPVDYIKNAQFEEFSEESANNRVSWCTEFKMLARRNW